VQQQPRRPASTLTVYAKTDLEHDGAATLAVMQQLYDSPARVLGRFGMAQPLLWQAEGGLHWQRALPGCALHDIARHVGSALAARVAGHLAALHATPVSGLELLSVGTLQRQARHAAAFLADVEPAWQPRLQRLVSWLQAGMAPLADEPVATLHGDLHLRNILVDGAQLAFIDFDSAIRGPAVMELGGWIADMLYRAVVEGQPRARVAASSMAFLRGYAHAGGRVPGRSLLAWSTVHALLGTRAYRCVANLKPGRFAAVPALLALAETIVQRGGVEAVFQQLSEAA
jgi:aminoglycoside phosphotransferase (APT) family kinase protein